MEKHIDKKAFNNFLENSSFIVVNSDKQPVKSFKDATDRSRLEDVVSENNLGLYLEDEWVVIDVDSKDNASAGEKLLEVIDYYGWQCNVMKTTRGYHFWFKKSADIKNYVNIVLPVGIRADIKASGRNAYVVIKKDGKFRDWIRFYKAVDKLPTELSPISLQAFQDLECPVGLLEGSRHDNLFRRIATLANAYWSKQKAYNLINVINSLLFASPLDAAEIEGIFSRSHTFFEQTKQGFYDADGKLQIFNVIDYIIAEFKIVRYGGNLFFYSEVESIYKLMQDNDIMRVIKSLIPKTKLLNIKEILNQIKISPKIPMKDIEPNVVALQNCYYDLSRFRRIPVDSNLFVINKINVTYDPRYKTEQKLKTVKNFLSDICSGNLRHVQLLLEFIGYSMTSHTNFQKSLLLYGQTASNGKSTFFDLLSYFFGTKNVSYLGFEELGRRFATSALLDKMVNIGADISTDYISEPSTFKKLVTGDYVSAEFKGKDRFAFKNKAKLIFATNKLPATQDKSNGFFRRFIIVPFDNEFTQERGNLDPKIKEKLLTPVNANSLFLLAIDALKNLTESGKFTKSDAINKLLIDYADSNNNVNVFILNDPLYTDDEIREGQSFINKTVVEKYNEYKRFCLEFSYKAYSLTKFREEVLLFFKPLKLTTRKIKKNDGVFDTFQKLIVKF
ncbi:transcriptional regulator [Mycoplasma miroungigenitalium]|uniref:Transcriptional regulator n=1 Tax=Mycoplasma miroungigenitalium TaxID=754515 RepID=A0A6M4J9N3_9MOLU|nr:phage/plasmid primase, P4 family [Mycoplasma miroungigenitalium]QJR43650.1 transcriptional regulator [Mycoplasma miroungigenitalium]